MTAPNRSVKSIASTSSLRWTNRFYILGQMPGLVDCLKPIVFLRYSDSILDSPRLLIFLVS